MHTNDSYNVVLLWPDGEDLRIRFGMVHSAVTHRLSVWFGTSDLGQGVWRFTPQGNPIPEDATVLKDALLISRSTFDALMAVERLMTWVSGRYTGESSVGPVVQLGPFWGRGKA